MLYELVNLLFILGFKKYFNFDFIIQNRYYAFYICNLKKWLKLILHFLFFLFFVRKGCILTTNFSHQHLLKKRREQWCSQGGTNLINIYSSFLWLFLFLVPKKKKGVKIWMARVDALRSNFIANVIFFNVLLLP